MPAASEGTGDEDTDHDDEDSVGIFIRVESVQKAAQRCSMPDDSEGTGDEDTDHDDEVYTVSILIIKFLTHIESKGWSLVAIYRL